jgi:hypothetical protein
LGGRVPAAAAAAAAAWRWFSRGRRRKRGRRWAGAGLAHRSRLSRTSRRISRISRSRGIRSSSHSSLSILPRLSSNGNTSSSCLNRSSRSSCSILPLPFNSSSSLGDGGKMPHLFSSRIGRSYTIRVGHWNVPLLLICVFTLLHRLNLRHNHTV